MRNPRKGEKIYLDLRHTVNGEKSNLYLDNCIRLGLLPDGGLTNQVLAKLSDADFDTYWVDVNTLLSSIINPIEIANVLFVAINGDNNTALPGRLDKMYSTVEQAMSVATSGQMVYVFPGTYNINSNVSTFSIAKNNVTLFLTSNAFLNINLNSLTTSDIFKSTNYNSIIKIQGTGKISVTSLVECFLNLSYDFELECNQLLLNNCCFYNTDAFENINIKSKDISSNSFIFIDGLGLNSQVKNINISSDKIVQALTSLDMSRFIEIKNTNFVHFTLNTDYLYFQKSNIISGCFYLNKNVHTTVFNIKVGLLVAKNYSITNAIFVSNADKSQKNININVDSEIPISSELDSTTGTRLSIETGVFKISGKVNLDNYQSSEVNKSIIDFNNRYTTLRYELDLNVSYTNDYTLFNITAFASESSITGCIYFEDLSNLTMTKPFVEYGRLTVGATTTGGLYPLLRNLILKSISSNPRSSLGKNNILGSNDLRVMYSASNRPIDNSIAITNEIIMPTLINTLL